MTSDPIFAIMIGESWETHKTQEREMTKEQKQAILYAYLDVTAVSKIVGDEDNWDWNVIAELGNATKETKVDLERAFPFLLEDNGELI